MITTARQLKDLIRNLSLWTIFTNVDKELSERE